MDEPVVRINPQQVYPMLDRFCHIAVEKFERTDADRNQQESLEQFEERDDQERFRALPNAFSFDVICTGAIVLE